MSENAPVFVKPALEESFRAAWETSRVLLFSAPCGCGKTAAAAALLRGKNVCRLSAADADFSPESVPTGCCAVLVDDLQLVTEPERQQALCELIRRRAPLRFVLLGRGREPGWLMPFELAGVLHRFELGDLLFDRETSRRLLEARGVKPTPAEMNKIYRDLNGYPIALELLSRLLAKGRPYGPETLAGVKRELFVYYDETVFHRFSPSLRRLLVYLAPFDDFSAELVRMVSGEERAGEMLTALQRDTTMLTFDGLDGYRFRPIFREYLFSKYRQSTTQAEQTGIFSRAALCYELSGKLDKALDCYAKAGEADRVSALLVKNAELHPGVGRYQELQDYYFALPREQILRSPTLMCGMSMLTAMTMDYEASEQWYLELSDYLSRLKRGDPERREAQGKLAYLDIALPQRGSEGLIAVINNVFRVMLDKKLKVPAFSVTSTLPSIMNGGKDFCEWSKRDDVLYATMRAPVETVLGRDGVGLADCAICESKFEKGKNVSEQMLALMARLGEIQTRGTPDMEFAVIGLMARIQTSQGKAQTALQTLESLREKYERLGETRFFGNLAALRVRILLRLSDSEAARDWLETEAPGNDARLWAMWRYQYLTRAMVQLAEGETQEPLLLLARLAPYCEACGRVMDGLHLRILTAICRNRQGGERWREELDAALDTSLEYGFIWPLAQYGAAILPMLRESAWKKDAAFLARLTAAAQTQAVFYPKFLKPCAQLLSPLSAAETQVLRLLCQNLSNQEIGEILDIRLTTVKSHVSHILQKLGVENRGEARQAAEALRLV
jgi:LuxR family maltose regulon positive regulatory protein